MGGSEIAQVRATAGETTHIATSLKEVLKIYAISQDRAQLLLANGVDGPADPRPDAPMRQPNFGCSPYRQEPPTASEMSTRLMLVGRRMEPHFIREMEASPDHRRE